MSELPVGWAECSLQDLLGPLSDGKILHQGWSPQCESTPAPQGEWGVLKTTAVQDGYFLEEENKKLPAALSPKPELEVTAGDLLMTCAGPRSRCGVICHVPKTRSKLIFSGKIYRFRPNAEHVEPKFLTHLLRTAELKEKIDEIKTGISESGMNMTRERFFALPVRLAPLAEQTRIAQKLDELLAQVDTLKARIDGIPALLKRFRQSVLAAAVSGRLTEEWSKEHSAPAFIIKKIGDAFKLIDGDRGPNYPKKEDYHLEGHCLFLSTKNVRKYGFLFDECTFISKEKHQALRAGTLCRGDIIITTRGTLGHVALYDEKVPFDVVRINSGMLILRKLEPMLLNEFFQILIASPSFQKLIDEQRTGSAQPQLPAKIIRGFEVAIPSTQEQTEIVRRVEQLFAFADQLEAKVASAKSRIDHLTQSILAKAFRGELVPQDPNDEPASVLLERIQAQRAATPKAKRGRKASV